MDKRRKVTEQIDDAEDYFKRMDKGRKRPWQPRERPIPIGQSNSDKKDPYKRTKFDWKKAMEDDNEEI